MGFFRITDILLNKIHQGFHASRKLGHHFHYFIDRFFHWLFRYQLWAPALPCIRDIRRKRCLFRRSPFFLIVRQSKLSHHQDRFPPDGYLIKVTVASRLVGMHIRIKGGFHNPFLPIPQHIGDVPKGSVYLQFPPGTFFVFERQVVMLAAGQISAAVIAEDKCRMESFR